MKNLSSIQQCDDYKTLLQAAACSGYNTIVRDHFHNAPTVLHNSVLTLQLQRTEYPTFRMAYPIPPKINDYDQNDEL